MGWTTGGIERVHDTSVDWWHRRVVVVRAGIGGIVGRHRGAIEHVLLTRDLDAGLKRSHGAFVLTPLRVEGAAPRQLRSASILSRLHSRLRWTMRPRLAACSSTGGIDRA